MRVRSDPQQYFSWQPESTSKVVTQYEGKYRGISEILDAVPEILDLVDRDLKRLSRPGQAGRRSTYTSENLLRALIVHQLEGTSLRRTQITLAHNQFLRDFLRLGTRPVPDFSTLDRAMKRIGPGTWERVNRILTEYAHSLDAVDPTKLRVDTTVVEATIRYPTDSSLLWDGWRTMYRLLELARQCIPGVVWNRFHAKKVKKLHLYITRYSPSPNKRRQRSVRRKQQQFIDQVARMLEVAAAFMEAHKFCPDLTLQGVALDIADNLPVVRKVLRVAKRVWLDGEKVPASDRLFSIFEPHVELIKRGRRHKPVEFGHMVLLGQSPEKFITQYHVMEEKIPDNKLPPRILEAHANIFGQAPPTLVADRGFCGTPEVMAELRTQVKQLAIPQRLSDWGDDVFVDLHRFRAGIEGSISVLKRAFGLLRCQYRGFKSFAAHVGLGVLCHNLVILATTGG